MRSFQLFQALILAFVLTNLCTGCNDPDRPVQTTEVAETAEQPTTEADPQAQPEPAPVEGNVITRSLPRFHDAFESDEAWLAWRDTFYRHKDFDRVPEAIGYYVSSSLYEDFDERIPTAAFFGAVFAQSDEVIDRSYDELMLEGRESELITLGYSMWLANTPHARRMTVQAREVWDTENLNRMARSLFQSKVQDTMERPIEDHRVVSMLWNEFFATGDEARLRKLVPLAFMHTAPEGSWQQLTGIAARKNLLRVLGTDPLVRSVVEDEAANNPRTPVRTDLTRLLSELEPNSARPGTPAGS